MIKPVDHLTYVYYKCPTCKALSDEVRLAESLIGKLHCEGCNTIYDIEPVERVVLKPPSYKCTSKSPKVTAPKYEEVVAKVPQSNNDSSKVQQILNGLISQGYAEEKVQHAFGIVKSRFNKLNKDDLFRELVLLLDETSR